MKLGYLGIDQYGEHYHIKSSPRKELLDQLYRKHADIMYCDTSGGKPKRKGYVIAGCWISVFEVHSVSDWERR